MTRCTGNADGPNFIRPLHDLAKAIRYARSRWTALTRYVDDRRLEISNNTAERAIRPLAARRTTTLLAPAGEGQPS